MLKTQDCNQGLKLELRVKILQFSKVKSGLVKLFQGRNASRILEMLRGNCCSVHT